MPVVNQTRYQPLDNPALIARLDKRFASEIKQLEKVGFERFQYVREGGEIGLVWVPLMLILMLVKGEVIRLRWSRYFLETCFPLLVNDKHATYASLSGMGVSFSTVFVDGTILMSVNTIRMDEDKAKVRRIAEERAFHHFYYETDILGTWNAHRTKLKAFEEKGHQPLEELTFEGFANMSLRYLEASFGVKIRK